MARFKDRMCEEPGCLKRSHYAGKCKEHFQSVTWRNHPFRDAWANMKARCKTGFKQSKDYAELDISYPAEWESFSGFYTDMFALWKPGLTLDRVNNNLGYSKENCRFATHAEQQRNTSVSRLTFEQAEEVKRLRAAGKLHRQLAEIFDVPMHIIAQVLRQKRGPRNAS